MANIKAVKDDAAVPTATDMQTIKIERVVDDPLNAIVSEIDRHIGEQERLKKTLANDAARIKQDIRQFTANCGSIADCLKVFKDGTEELDRMIKSRVIEHAERNETQKTAEAS